MNDFVDDKLILGVILIWFALLALLICFREFQNVKFLVFPFTKFFMISFLDSHLFEHHLFSLLGHVGTVYDLVVMQMVDTTKIISASYDRSLRVS